MLPLSSLTSARSFIVNITVILDLTMVYHEINFIRSKCYLTKIKRDLISNKHYFIKELSMSVVYKEPKY